jgi:hypothetical protein
MYALICSASLLAAGADVPDLDRAARAIKTQEWDLLEEMSKQDLDEVKPTGALHHGIPDRELLLRLRLTAMTYSERERAAKAISPESISCGFLAVVIATCHPRGSKEREIWEKAAYDRFAFHPPESNPHFEAVRYTNLYFLVRETDHLFPDTPPARIRHLSAQYALSASEWFRRAGNEVKSEAMYFDFAREFAAADTGPSPIRDALTARLRTISQEGEQEETRRQALVILSVLQRD